MILWLAVAFAQDTKLDSNKNQLKLNLAPGDTRSLSLNVEGDIHWMFDKQPIDIHATARMDCDVGVQSIDTVGRYTVHTTQTRVAYGVKGMGPDYSFDSDIPADKTKDESIYARASSTCRSA